MMDRFMCAIVVLILINEVIDAYFLGVLRVPCTVQSFKKRKSVNPISIVPRVSDTGRVAKRSNAIVLFDEKHVDFDSHQIQSLSSTAVSSAASPPSPTTVSISSTASPSSSSSASLSLNGGAGRRVLRLIDKVNDRLLNDDFAGPIWDAIRYEASAISEGDLKAATLMSNFILSQPSFDEAVIEFVANQLEQPLFQATQIRNLFSEIVAKNPQMGSYWALDLMASAMRDNSQPNAVSVLLFNKGFHSLVTYRIANALWHEGRDGIAIYFQSLSSRTFGSDIHPACTIGHGCSLSSGTGVVIGETAIIGNDCYISHDVTLGGNGKDKGDRHPKVGNGVYLAAGATVLGNIIVGEGAVINAGSVVTKPVAAYTRVGGVPAKLIGKFAVNETYIAEMAQSKYREEDAPNQFDFPKAFINFHKELDLD